MAESSPASTASGAATVQAFSAVPPKPDHADIEQRMLAAWEAQGTFARLVEKNRGGETFSFYDGPITANNPMGVHHAWGRTLKDIFQRWYALRGFDQRYQNGFDCQGLWVEVEVEKALGLNSKHEIEDYGIDRFATACRDRVAKYAAVQTKQSQRLGQWMHWDESYFTMSDTNISYIWKFLAECNKRGWLYIGHRPMVWCPRCGTSLSQHELIDSYSDVTHPSLFVRFPLVDDEHQGESLAVWTTTPWTLPANAAAAVDPAAEYSLVEVADHGNVWVASARVADLFGDDATVERTCRGNELAGSRYQGPFEHLEAAAGIERRVVAWQEASIEEGTGAVHIAPGCGAEDYELGQQEQLPMLTPVDEAGVFIEGYGPLTGVDTQSAAGIIAADLKERGLLLKASEITHRYPGCWRCGTELIFRLVDEWFIACDEIRETMIEVNRDVEWVPSFYGKRMEDWLRNMGDWCISRKRYWGLPLPFYPCEKCDTMHVLDSKERLAELAVSGMENLRELHRPWIDDVVIACPDCGSHLRRLSEVGDCWLDAGIVPFATLGWNNPQRIDGGYATGASEGLSTADLPSHEEWERWFPADLIIEMREQIRLWFYSLLFMSVVLEGRSPYRRVLAFEKVHDETGRPMHKSWGNAIWFDDAVEEMGADVMRWQYAAQTPSQNLNFGYGPATEIKRRFLTLWNVYSFFTTYANIDGWTPNVERIADSGPAGPGLALLDPERFDSQLDKWLCARTHELVQLADQSMQRWDTPAYTRAVEAYIEELSTWYVRRSRRRFWKAEAGEEDRDSAYSALWGALVTLARVLAPVMPFLSDEMWNNLVGSPARTASSNGALSELDSIHLAGWPAADKDAATATVLEEVEAVQRVLALARAARNEAKIKLRQPLREVVIFRRSLRGSGVSELERLLERYTDDIKAELSVKQIRMVDDPQDRWTETLMPLLPKLGPKYGKDVAAIRKAVASGDVELLEDGRARVGEFTLETDEYEHRSKAAEGYAAAEDHEWVVAVTTGLDEELLREGRAREIVRQLQQLRKAQGLEVSDRIQVRWHASGGLAAAFAQHADSIADETLALSFDEADTPLENEFSVDGESASVSIQRV